MKQSDLNHLRRLLGWVRCDIGQDPAGQQQTMIDIAGKLGADSIDADAKARLVEGYRRAEAVPVYVRDAVKALEKALTAVGRDPGVVAPRATAENRANTGFDPGAGAGREPVLDDVQIERGLAEIGVYVWGQRGEDWLAGVEYLARLLRAGEACPAVVPLQNHPDATAWPVACRNTPAAPPTLRRDDTGGADAARRSAAAHDSPEVQIDRASAGQAESRRAAKNLQVMQEALRLMPSDEARRVAREAEAVSGKVTPDQYVLSGAIEVIARLRAPVADEQFKAAFPNGVLTAARFHELWESAGHNPNPDRTLLENLAWQVGKFAGLVAKEASTPVADERADAQGYGSPADVAQRIEQYLAHDGRMNSGTQLLYEAMKALRASQGDRNDG